MLLQDPLYEKLLSLQLLSESGEVQLSPEEMAQAREIEITHEQWRKSNSPWPTICVSNP